MNDDLFNKRLGQESALQRALRELLPPQGILADQTRIAGIVDPHRNALEQMSFVRRIIDQERIPNRFDDVFSQISMAESALPNFAERFRLPDMAVLAGLQSCLAQPGIEEAIRRYGC